jgi:hypothetical protein
MNCCPNTRRGVSQSIIIATLPIIALLAACTSPEQEAAWRASAQRPVTCAGADNCAVQWSKAMDWVQDKSQYRLQIQTAGPTDESASSAFTITKRALGGGAYQIVFRSGCDNIIGCVPTGLALQASFNNYVLGQ